VRTCPNCGVEIFSQRSECARCGAPLEAAQWQRSGPVSLDATTAPPAVLRPGAYDWPRIGARL